LQIAIRAIDNSRGVVIPKVILEQSGIERVAKMSIDGEETILSKSKSKARENWAVDAQNLAKSESDRLILGDFANDEDGDWVWKRAWFPVGRFG
jgi:antitoxin MazE